LRQLAGEQRTREAERAALPAASLVDLGLGEQSAACGAEPRESTRTRGSLPAAHERARAIARALCKVQHASVRAEQPSLGRIAFQKWQNAFRLAPGEPRYHRAAW